MEITNEERREVAENLRNLEEGNRVRYKEEFFEMLDETVMDPYTGYHEMNDVFGRIADLIESPKCHRIENDQRYWGCSRCGAFVYWDAVTNFTGVVPTNFCPYCGAEVVE